MPKISIIIPIYNVESYLKECLDSILNQTLRDIEVICVNDGSTDSSLSILEKYKNMDDRIIIVDQENQGISIARNNGLACARGKYIEFIDSDDYLFSNNYLESLYNACEKYDADIAVAGIVRGNEKLQSVILKIESEISSSDYAEKLRICDVPNSCYVNNKLVKRTALISSGLSFPPRTVYEDVHYTYRLLYYMDKLVGVPDVIYFYRKRPKSLITKKNKKYEQDFLVGQENMYKFFEEHGVDVSDYAIKTKRYKLFGLTIFKTISKNRMRKNILFNFIKWQVQS